MQDKQKHATGMGEETGKVAVNCGSKRKSQSLRLWGRVDVEMDVNGGVSKRRKRWEEKGGKADQGRKGKAETWKKPDKATCEEGGRRCGKRHMRGCITTGLATLRMCNLPLPAPSLVFTME